MAMQPPEPSLSRLQAVVKRGFDLAGALIGLIATCWLFLPAWLAASVDTRANGFFTQARVGRHGRIFRVIKLRTMRPAANFTTVVTTGRDPRITRLGRFFRRTKLDELPQLWNVLLGHMSFVGPRPDVPGFADRLEGEDRAVLSVRPGVTGPASVYFRDEEQLLTKTQEPERFNDEVLWPAKVTINLGYLRNYSFMEDVKLIADTVFPSLRCSSAAKARVAAERSQEGIFSAGGLVSRKTATTS